jgi:hypothetical protein
MFEGREAVGTANAVDFTQAPLLQSFHIGG